MASTNVRSAGWLIAVILLLTAGLLVQPYRAQQASRYALTAAIVEEGTVVLDSYEDVLGVDRAVREGHIYSDKAPGQPLLAVPFFALGKVLGIEDATTLRVEGNLGLWWVTLWSSVIPGMALVLLVHRRIVEVQPSRAGLVTFVLFFGTLLLPFSSLLFGHVLAAALLFAAYLLLTREASVPVLALGGLLAGLAVTVEYTAALGVIVLTVFGVMRHRWRLGAFLAGGLVAALGLAIYNQVAFGDPLVLSYQYTAFTEVTDSARPLFVMFSSATLENALRLLFDGRGLIVATPIVLVAVVGAWFMLRRNLHEDAAIGLAMFFIFLLLPLFWGNPWGGDSPGARYLSPALPFLGVPLAWSFGRWPRMSFLASGISVVTMLVATLADPLVSRFSRGGLGIWINRLLEGDTVPTLFTIAFGRAGWLIHFTVLVVLLTTFLMYTKVRSEVVDF